VVADDGSARIQTVNEVDNPKFHTVIEAFRRLTGVPMVLNTSFNLQDPIVDTPADAVRAFLNSGLDVLVMQSYVARKSDDVRTSRPASAGAVPLARSGAAR
jgi:carbamoyltransferase